MGLFFRAHAVSLAFDRIVEPGFLRDLAAGFDDPDLAINFVLQRFANKAERIYVLDFSFRAKLFLAAWTHAHVGIATQRPLFHIAIADPGIEDDFLQAGEVFVGFGGRRDVGLADDFDERDSTAVQVDGCGLAGIGKAFVQALACVFFEVHACDADFLCLTTAVTISIPPNSASGLSYCEI